MKKSTGESGQVAESTAENGEQPSRARPEMSAGAAAAEWVHIESLKSWDRNPKRRTEGDIREAMGSLRRFGFCTPMVAWGSRTMLVAGHARRAALARILKQDPELDGKGGANGELAEKNRKLRKSLAGPSAYHAPVRILEFSSMAEAEAYAIRDNNDFGENDEDALGAILRELSAGGTEVGDLGFDEDELGKLFGDAEEDKAAGDQSKDLKSEWLVLVECEDENHQLETIDTLQRDGYSVRALQ